MIICFILRGIQMDIRAEISLKISNINEFKSLHRNLHGLNFEPNKLKPMYCKTLMDVLKKNK